MFFKKMFFHKNNFQIFQFFFVFFVSHKIIGAIGFGSFWGLVNEKLRLLRQNGKRWARRGSGRRWDTLFQMLCATYKDPQDLLKFLEALGRNTMILNANLADGDDFVSPVVMAKLIDNPETVLMIYGEVSPVWFALATVLETPGIAENDYWYEKVQVCYWLPGAGKTGKGGIEEKALVLVASVKSKKKVCTTLWDCEASQYL